MIFLIILRKFFKKLRFKGGGNDSSPVLGEVAGGAMFWKCGLFKGC